MLDLTSASLPPSAVEVLRDEASHDPACLAGARRGSPCEIRKGVVVAPDGVFVADLKVAELAQVVTVIARGDVAEVRRAVDTSWAQRSLVTGALTGALTGGAIGGLFCAAYHGCEASDVLYVAGIGAAIYAPIVLATGGAAHAYAKSKELVYRAPPG